MRQAWTIVLRVLLFVNSLSLVNRCEFAHTFDWSNRLASRLNVITLGDVEHVPRTRSENLVELHADWDILILSVELAVLSTEYDVPEDNPCA